MQTWVRQYFDESKIRQSKPFEAIAHGALQLLQGIEIQDFLYHSYGVRYWDRRQMLTIGIQLFNKDNLTQCPNQSN